MIFRHIKCTLIAFLLQSPFYAGVDLSGYVERTWIKTDDILMIKMQESSFDKYCAPGWSGFNLYIPVSDKNFQYYYGLITTAIAKKTAIIYCQYQRS